MGYDFGAISYYISAGDFTPVDVFFSEFYHKVRLYEDQTANTLKLYEQDKISQQAKLKETHDEEQRLAAIVYDRVYEDALGSERERQGLAIHESGVDYLTDRYAMESGLLDSRYADMADIFYNSTIITLYTLLEAELKRLCNVWRKLTGHKIALADFGHRDYTGASFTYLEKVMDLEMTRLEPFKNKLTDLQNLRNRLIHDNGLFTKEALPKVTKLVESSGGGLVAIPDGEDYQLRITGGAYVMDWFTVIREFFEELFWLTDAQMDHRFLKERLQFIFGVMNNAISIESIAVQRKGRKKEIAAVVVSAHPEAAYRLQVLLQIKDGEADKIVVVNNVKGNPQAERLVKVLKQNDNILLNRAFSGLLQTRGGKVINFVVQKQL